MQWSQISASEKYKTLTPEQQAKVQDGYFNQYIAPKAQESGFDPEEARTKFRAKVGAATVPVPAEEKPGFFSNAGRLAGERAGDLAGNLARGVKQAGDYLEEKMPMGGFVFDKGYPRYVGADEYKMHSQLGEQALEQAAKKAEGLDLGGESRHNPESIKGEWSQGNYGAAAGEAVKFAGESFIQSTADMAAMLTSLPLYVGSFATEMGTKRAANKGKPEADITDTVEALPFALGSALLDRIVPAQALRGVTGKQIQEVGQEAVQATLPRMAAAARQGATKEALTEAFQEGVLEYVGERYGTDAQMKVGEAIEQGAWASLAGAGGGAVMGAAGGYRSPKQQLEPEPEEDLLQEPTAVPGLEHKPQRMITLPDGTTAWESEADELRDMRAASQHPGAARETSQAQPPTAQPQGLEYRPDRMVTLPDGTTAWESQLTDRPPSVAAQHPASPNRTRIIDQTPEDLERELGGASPMGDAMEAEIAATLAEFSSAEQEIRQSQGGPQIQPGALERGAELRQAEQMANGPQILPDALTTPPISPDPVETPAATQQAPAPSMLEDAVGSTSQVEQPLPVAPEESAAPSKLLPTEAPSASTSDASLPPILTTPKAKYLKDQAKAQKLKKDSPGYADALSRLEDEYEAEVDRAQASLPFEKFQELNSGTPETINRQAWQAMRDEFGIKDVETTTAEKIDSAAAEAATSPLNDLPEPTEAQKLAGNYKKAHIKIHGLDISIENPKGSTRSGTDPDGKPWEVEMAAHYGYLKRSSGGDGENIDIFIGPNPESEKVFIVDQMNSDGSWDEHKVVLGATSKLRAHSAYKANYTKDWKVGPITEMTMDDFKAWLRDGDTTKPLNQDHFAGAGKLDGSSKAIVDNSAQSKPSQKQIPLRQRKAQEFVGGNVGDLVAPSADFDYLTAGRNYTIDGIQKNGDVTLRSERGMTTVSFSTLSGAVRRGITFAKVDNNKTQPAPTENFAPEATPESKPDQEKERPTTTATLTTKGAKLADKAENQIQDFGETIQGARKHTASLREILSDKNIDTASVPLSKSFPVPEYEKLVAAGADPEVLALIAFIRANIKNKPKRGTANWASEVDSLRQLANRLLSGNLQGKEVVSRLERTVVGAKNIPDILALSKEIAPSQIKRLADFSLNEVHYSLYRGEKNVDKWVAKDTSKKSGFGGMGNEAAFNSKAEALAFIKSQVAADNPEGKPSVKFDIWTMRGEPGVWIGKKIGTRKFIQLKKVESAKEAREYIATHNDDLAELLNKKKQVGSERRVEQNERIGKDYRRGANVSSELFSQTFGFRGVQFGNYVENDRRQQDLNNAYDGLLDLAEVLGIPPKAISLNGELGLAFGARGTGGKRPASAHYEASDIVQDDAVVINLTKGNGPGSLAHEWWHALDNYFARMGQLIGEDGSFITELRRPSHKQEVRDGRATVVPVDPSQYSVRPEVYDAFKSVVRVIQKDTQLLKRSGVLDNRRTKDYWTTMREATARAFERFVIDKLAESGYESDYLATVLPKSAWDETEAFFGNTAESYPYPTDEEAKLTDEAYAALFKEIRAKETDQGVMLYSKSDNKKPSGIPLDELQKITADFFDRFPGAAEGISVRLFGDEERAFGPNLGERDRGKIKGGFNPATGDLVLIAANLNGAPDALETLQHEILVHHGLGFLPEKQLTEALNTVKKAVLEDRQVNKIWQKIEKIYDDKPAAEQLEEVLARIAEKLDTGTWAKTWNNVLLAIRKALAKLGVIKPLTRIEDLKKIIYDFADAFEQGRSPGKRNTAPMQSRAADSEPRPSAGVSALERVKSAIPKTAAQKERAVQRAKLDTSTRQAFDKLGDKDKTIFQRVRTEIKRQLTPGGLLPDDIFKLKIVRDGQMNADEIETRVRIQSFTDAVQKAYGKPYDDLTATQKANINAALRGEQARLPASVRQQLGYMRDEIKRLSAIHMQQLMDEIKQLTAGAKSKSGTDLGDESQPFSSLGFLGKARKKAALLETISENFDTYLHRSYRAFDDPAWPKKVPPKVYADAVEYLAAGYAGDNPITSEHRDRARKKAALMLQEGTAFDSMGAFISESKLGAKDLSIIKKRKDIAPEIRALLGEYEDAPINYTKSVSKMARLVYNHEFLTRMQEIGLEQGFLFEKENLDLKATKKIAGEASEVYAPLNGLYTFPEFDQALKDALGKEDMAAWYRAIVMVNGMVKFGKTVLSPTTAMRNFYSAFFFSMANGHFNLTQMKKSIGTLQTYFRDKDDGGKAYMKKLRRLGVVYDSPYASEMMELLKDSRLEETALQWKPIKGVRGAIDYAQRFYSFGDDFWKIIGFENEKALLMKHRGMSETEAETEAAERIRNTYPTYSMTGRFVNSLRRFPLVGTFVSFPAEIIRTSYHITRYMAQDMKASRRMGMQKAAGFAIASGAIAGLSALSKAWFDVGDDEEDALKTLAPEWQKNSNFLYWGRDEKGALQYMDLSFLDPYNYWKRPINAFMRDQDPSEAIADGAWEMLKPFFGQDIAFQAITEALNNKKGTGARVFNPEDTADNQALDISGHLAKAFQPGIASNLGRMWEASQGTITSSGKKYSMEEEVAALAGFRLGTFDPKTALYYQSFGFQDRKRNASALLNTALRDPNKKSDDDLSEAYERAMTARERAYKDMIKVVTAAKKAGMSPLQVMVTLKNSGVSKEDSAWLARGEMPPWKPSAQMMTGAIKKAAILFDKETAEEFKRREQFVKKLNRDERK